jgi:Flp pilus assembly protein CpaB
MAAIAAPRRLPRLRAGHRNAAVGLLVFLLGLAVMGAAALRGAPPAEVLVATAELPVGTVLTEAHLGVVQAALDDATLAGYVPRSELAAALGQPLREAAHRGALLRREAIAGPPPLADDQLAIAVAVRPEHAVAGALEAGDAVLVIQARPDRAEVVLDGARLLAYDPRSGLVTFALTRPEALRLAEARARGDVQLLLLPPARGLRP